MTAFEDFVNIELPKRVATNDSPPLTAGHLGFATGTALLVAFRSMLLTDMPVSAIRHNANWYWGGPLVADQWTGPLLWDNVTFEEVFGIVNGGTSVSIQIKRRSKTVPFSGGTNILSSDLVCTTGGASTTNFVSSGNVDANQWLAVEVTAKSGSPTDIAIGCKIKLRS